MRIHLVPVLLLALAAACQKESSKPEGSGGAGGAGKTSAAVGTDLDSKDILARTETAAEVDVKHVLIGWKDLARNYGGRMDPRAAERSHADAAKLARQLADQLRARPADIDKLIAEHGEDPGAKSGKPYTVAADTAFVPEFKQLALRLKENEVGIVTTTYGYHVMVRVAPPPPDPLESADILARPGQPGPVHVQHVLIGWKDVPAATQVPLDPRATERTKADADRVAKEILDQVRAGEDMKALMKAHSEDPGSKDSGDPYEVSARTQFVEPFKKLALRLEEGEAGMVITDFGWHVIKRIPPPPPPPPDPLESAAILARAPVTDKAQVKHILLGYKDLHAGDERAKARDRKALDALVAKTLARLKKGEKIEALMAELSEDPGSATTGTSYEATPDARLVPPFKDLSLRLNVGEVGVVKTQFGFHIIQRVE